MQLRAPRVAGELQVHFVPIGSGDPAPAVVFVEDVGRMRAQAQQMKLVALGRLTASIAHEKDRRTFILTNLNLFLGVKPS